MKNLFFTCLFCLFISFSFAKKVRFACDMTGQVVNTTGMHISGDFQTAAGFAGGDWNSATTSLLQEGTTDIYSIVVDIPAFNKYEYKFVNGDLFYEVEFVPEPSRVGYNFNDNRWIYIDSLANDTSDIGALLFGQNAPAGLTMVRFFVDMANVSASPNGVHVAGNFQGFDPSTTLLYSFGSYNTNGSYIYEVMAYVPQGTYEYKFFNGNSNGTEEIIPGMCSVNSNREIVLTGDTLLNLVCFGSCIACPAGVAELTSVNSLNAAPNPSADYVMLSWMETPGNISILLSDISGRRVREYKNIYGNNLVIGRDQLETGIYFATLMQQENTSITTKLIFK